MSRSLSQFSVTVDTPNLEFFHPILGRAERLLRDSARRSCAVATAVGPITKRVPLVSGSSRGADLLRRHFLEDQSGWSLVEDRGLNFMALRVSDGQ